MKKFRVLVSMTALAWIGATSPAGAAVFTFSYTFGDGVTASGSLTGTQNGVFVENVTDVSLSLNGAAVLGTIYASKFDGGSFSYLSGAVLSFDAWQNNFVFSNSNLVNGDFGYDSIFYLLNEPGSGHTTVASSLPLGVFGSQDLPTLTSNWSLQPASSSVAESGTTALLLGLALAGLGCLRRRAG